MTTLSELIPLLEQGTRERKLAWTSLGANGVVLAMAENSIALELDRDVEGEWAEYIIFRSNDGRALDALSSDTGKLNERLGELRVMARRQADGVDDSLQNAARELQRLLEPST